MCVPVLFTLFRQDPYTAASPWIVWLIQSRESTLAYYQVDLCPGQFPVHEHRFISSEKVYTYSFAWTNLKDYRAHRFFLDGRLQGPSGDVEKISCRPSSSLHFFMPLSVSYRVQEEQRQC
jgi:hypothetical protein